MVFDEMLMPEKQKKKSLRDILSSFESEIKKKKNKEQVYKNHLCRYFRYLLRLPYPFQHAEAAKWIATVNALKEQYLPRIKKFSYNTTQKKAFTYIHNTASQKADYLKEFTKAKADIKALRKKIRKLKQASRS